MMKPELTFNERTDVASVTGVTRTVVPAAVICDAADAAVGQINHLVLPRIRVQPPTVEQLSRTARSPGKGSFGCRPQ
jgi:hypothetical protein